MTKATCLKFLFFLSLITNAQSRFVSNLRQYDPSEGISENRCVIYGTFIPRGGSWSGGANQFVTIRNVETNFVSRMEVKRMKTTKEGEFCLFIRPGEYEPMDYTWTTTYAYVMITHTQPIMRKDSLNDSTLTSSKIFRFSVPPSSLVYVGRWQFKDEPVSFTDEKDEADKKFIRNYGHLDFLNAKRSVPE